MSSSRVSREPTNVPQGDDGSFDPGAAVIVERTVARVAFTTPRADAGHLALFAGPRGLVMVQQTELPDGSVLEFSRAIDDTETLVDYLQGLTFAGDGDSTRRRLIRVAEAYFSKDGEV